MIGRTNCGAGGGGTVGVTIYGGANEVITYSGKASGTFTLDSSGAGTVELKKGVYTFTAGLSGLSISKACENGTVVRLRPERFIYWYGVLGDTITHSGKGSISYGDTSFTLSTGGNDYSYAKSDIDCSQDTKLSVTCGNVTLVSNYSVMKYGSQSVKLAKDDTASLTFTYNASHKPTLSIFDYQNRYDSAVIKEWYLGNREAG